MLQDVPVVILCGGMGMRLKEETEFRPKPMVEIGTHPILWHIMTSYASFGVQRFILCLGFKGDVIRDYFVNYHLRTCDAEVVLGNQPCVNVLSRHAPENWRVTLAETGPKTQTGGRVARIKKYINNETFMLTYGDAVCDVDIEELYNFHKSHGALATVTGVRPPSRFGELECDGDKVTSFAEKPVGGGLINGGFFVFNKGMFDYLREDEDCILERDPLERLAADGELRVRPHDGFWQCMDTLRDVQYLRSMVAAGELPWMRRAAQCA
ncbi:MAG TPA: glucose-1-phosphate cytidylyltransferase [Bryobacteraceae bacterium]|nr:glucose-1-phosphate cytidylyltransferase [Bryobacteraceae bacterium]